MKYDANEWNEALGGANVKQQYKQKILNPGSTESARPERRNSGHNTDICVVVIEAARLHTSCKMLEKLSVHVIDSDRNLLSVLTMHAFRDGDVPILVFTSRTLQEILHPTVSPSCTRCA